MGAFLRLGIAQKISFVILKGMNVKKCDICKKKLKGDPVKAGVGYFGREDFCLSCGKPILDFLKKHKFISKDNKRK